MKTIIYHHQAPNLGFIVEYPDYIQWEGEMRDGIIPPYYFGTDYYRLMGNGQMEGIKGGMLMKNGIDVLGGEL